MIKKHTRAYELWCKFRTMRFVIAIIKFAPELLFYNINYKSWIHDDSFLNHKLFIALEPYVPDIS